jgi:3-methyladenine DNA glycosylase Tag
MDKEIVRLKNKALAAMTNSNNILRVNRSSSRCNCAVCTTSDGGLN